MSKKFLCRYYDEIQELDPRELFLRIQQEDIPMECKIAKMEGLRQQLRTSMLHLSQLEKKQKYRKQQNLSTCLTERSDGSQQQDLWEQIDHLQHQIVEARQTKIQLNDTLEDYEEEMFQLHGIHESKRRFNEQLGEQILKKRKKLELNKSWSHDNDKMSKSFDGAATYWRESIRHFWN